MKPIQLIMAVVDPTTKTQPCIAKATALARACNAKIELFACDNHAMQQSGVPSNGRSVALDALLESLAAPVRALGIEVNCSSVVAAPLHAAILRHAALCDANIVFKDTHHHPLVSRAFLTNTDWQLIRECTVPLLLTKPPPWHAAPIIVAAVDPGHANDKSDALDQEILHSAHSIGSSLKSDLHVAHAFIPASLHAALLVGTPPAWVPVPNQTLDGETAAMRATLKSLTQGMLIPEPNLHLEFGVPSDVLLQVVSAVCADILVIGAVSRNALDRLFIGATAERSLERLPCDALVVKTPDFAADLPF